MDQKGKQEEKKCQQCIHFVREVNAGTFVGCIACDVVDSILYNGSHAEKCSLYKEERK